MATTTTVALPVALAALLAVFGLPAAPAEEAAPLESPAAAPPTAASPAEAPFAEQRAAAQADPRLTEEMKVQAAELFDRAAAELSRARESKAKLAELETRVESAPGRIEELEARLKAPPQEAPPPELPADATLTQARDRASQVRGELTAAREELARRDEALSSLRASGTTVSQRITDLAAEIKKSAEAAGAPAEQPDGLAQARAVFQRARREAQESELARVRRLEATTDTLLRLETLERDLLAAEVARLEGVSQAVDEQVQRLREADARLARQQAEAVKAATASLPAPVAALAETNATLREELESITADQAQVGDRLRAVEARFGELESDLAAIRRQVETAGPSEAIGRMLRRRLERLPSALDYRRLARSRTEAINAATDRRIDIEEQRRELSDLNAGVERVIAEVGEDVANYEPDWLAGQVRELLAAKRDTLADLDRTFGRYLTQLTAVDAAEGQLVAAVQDSTDFIREQLLWIRSLPPVSFNDILGFPAALAWIFAPSDLRQALRDARTEFREHEAFSIAAAAALLALLAWRSRARRRLGALAALTRKVRTDAFSHTVKATALTLVVASGWPMLLVLVGWHLRADPIGEPYSVAIGIGLLSSAAMAYLFGVVKAVTREDGLAKAHFRWPDPVRLALARQAAWLGRVLVPATFLVTATASYGDPVSIAAVGRPAFLAGAAALVLFVWRFAGRTSALQQHIVQGHADTWTTRLRPLWFPVALVFPAALAVASALGYHHTARELAELMLGTTWYIAGLLLLRDVLLRWFYVGERRSRFEALVRQREEARAQRERGDQVEERDVIEVEVSDVDYRQLGEQGRAVVNVALLVGLVLSLGTLWGELLPVIGFLERTELPFSKSVLVEGVQEIRAVTLSDIGVGLLILLGTVFAAKNLSGVLEFTLLRRLKLDSGGRYALVTLSQYLIVAVGVISGLSVLGLQWSKLQWLIAALGVGLGFGLQEIVANFVSGIILLIERPVRVGDIVTVGAETGTVTRIRIRATTITNFDKRELIVPNKEFITSQLLNWTLTDTVNRVVITVGIGYGADPRRARDIIEQTARDAEHVLDDPAPLITFEGFGDNALTLILRCYLPNLDNRLATVTWLHDTIYERFAEAGIPIAFPQRDLHLDTSRPLEIRLRRDPPGAPAG